MALEDEPINDAEKEPQLKQKLNIEGFKVVKKTV
jgi:hypothetical protein